MSRVETATRGSRPEGNGSGRREGATTCGLGRRQSCPGARPGGFTLRSRPLGGRVLVGGVENTGDRPTHRRFASTAGRGGLAISAVDGRKAERLRMLMAASHHEERRGGRAL